MSPLQPLRIALLALYRNKLRSSLTMLGIIIGVAAVIAMVAIGQGARAKVEETFAAMGTNLLLVLPGTTTTGGARGGYGSLPTLTFADVAALRRELPTVRYAVPVLRSNAVIVTEQQNWTTTIYGTTPDYFLLRSWRATTGGLFGDSDLEANAKVAVLGSSVAKQLFGANAIPLGTTVRIRNIPFQVIGVLETKGQSPLGQDYDDAVVIPVTTYESKIQGGLNGYVSGVIMVGATTAQETVRTASLIVALLRERHHLQMNVEDDFSIRNLADIAKAQQQGTRIMTMLLACVAGVSLVVGGIGVMNIMLVSVTERTREIGLRMAIGAQPGQILIQFLVEALVLSCIGGLLGIGLGIGIAELLAWRFEWPFHIQLQVITLAVGFSLLVGVVFGIYPARKASLLDPIVALRSD